jgi:hypothetical protein
MKAAKNHPASHSRLRPPGPLTMSCLANSRAVSRLTLRPSRPHCGMSATNASRIPWGWSSLSPHLTPERGLPLSLRLLEGQGGDFPFDSGRALGRFGCCQLPPSRKEREKDGAPLRWWCQRKSGPAPGTSGMGTSSCPCGGEIGKRLFSDLVFVLCAGLPTSRKARDVGHPAGPAFPPILFPRVSCPCPSVFWRDRAGIFFSTQADPWGDWHAGSSRPLAKNAGRTGHPHGW